MALPSTPPTQKAQQSPQKRKAQQGSVLIAGATGMVGGAALRLSLEHPEVSRVTTVGRRPTGLDHPKLKEVTHNDFLELGPIEEALEAQDLALYCVGVYSGQLPDDEFRRITVDYTVRFAEALRARSPGAVFCLLSGQGADQTERSRMAFARYKGAAEKALLQMGFPRVHFFRPGYIYPSAPRRAPNLSYRVMRWIYPGLRLLGPSLSVTSEDLAWAMLEAGLHGTPEHPAAELENRDIRRIASQRAS